MADHWRDERGSNAQKWPRPEGLRPKARRDFVANLDHRWLWPAVRASPGALLTCNAAIKAIVNRPTASDRRPPPLPSCAPR